MLRHNVVKDLTSIDMNSKAIVGIDFGSNNTCVYYNANDRGAMPVGLKTIVQSLSAMRTMTSVQMLAMTSYYSLPTILQKMVS